MRNIEEFRSYYDTRLLPGIVTLEELRLRALSKKSNFTFLLIGIYLLAVLLMLVLPKQVASAVMITTLVSFSFLPFLYKAIVGHLVSDFVTHFKKNIIGEGLLKFFDPGLTYEPEQGIFKKAVEISEVFWQAIDEFESDDQVKGTVKGTFLQFSEVHAKRKGKSIFDGLFFIASFNKHFTGGVIVEPNTLVNRVGSTVSGIFTSFDVVRPPQIELEDPEFSKEFRVYGTDPVVSRYILSLRLMQRMLEFKKKANTDVYFSFVRERIFVAVACEEKLFEPSLEQQIGFETMEYWARSISLVFGIVEDLKLNVHIWGK